MAKSRSKSDLPIKICPVCGRPFAWRKKWADCWDEVKYCSDRCRRRRPSTKPDEADTGSVTDADSFTVCFAISR
ncbi:DUF2256 domain-containing protein [Leptolyngbya sp. GB1-A1]|uniref:DUF2256 domain-containing protein n=1 Tax=Leptolyngbya sp. GB1-A1 TaxID=2933908 RepID=UPI003298144D